MLQNPENFDETTIITNSDNKQEVGYVFEPMEWNEWTIHEDGTGRVYVCQDRIQLRNPSSGGGNYVYTYTTKPVIDISGTGTIVIELENVDITTETSTTYIVWSYSNSSNPYNTSSIGFMVSPYSPYAIRLFMKYDSSTEDEDIVNKSLAWINGIRKITITWNKSTKTITGVIDSTEGTETLSCTATNYPVTDNLIQHFYSKSTGASKKQELDIVKWVVY